MKGKKTWQNVKTPFTSMITLIQISIIGVRAAAAAGNEWDKVDLTATVKVTSTTASIDYVSAAPFERQHHAITVPCYTIAFTQSVTWAMLSRGGVWEQTGILDTFIHLRNSQIF